MRRNKHHAIRDRHRCFGQTRRPPARCLLQPPRGVFLRLLIIECIEAGAAGIADQDDPLEAGAFQKVQSGRDIEQCDLVFQPHVIADRSRRLREDRVTGRHEIGHKIMRRKEFARMHDAQNGVRRSLCIEEAIDGSAILRLQGMHGDGDIRWKTGHGPARIPKSRRRLACRHDPPFSSY